MNKQKIVVLRVQPPQKSFIPVDHKNLPFNVALLAGILKADGHEMTLVDCFLKFNDWEKSITEISPDFVLVETSGISFANAKIYLEKLYKILHNTPDNSAKIVVYGSQPTLIPEIIPEYIDYMVKGLIWPVVTDILAGTVSERVVESKTVSELESLPMPDYSIFINENQLYDCEYDLTSPVFKEEFPVFELPVFALFDDLTYNRSVDLVKYNQQNDFPMEYILKVLQHLVNTYQAKGFILTGHNNTLSEAYLKEFSEHLINLEIPVKWACSVYPDVISLDLLDLMAKSGCHFIEILAVSGSQSVIDVLDTEFLLDDIIKSVKITRDSSMDFSLTFIFGLPGESELDKKRTEAFIKSLEPLKVNKEIYISIPGSYLYPQAIGFPHRNDENGLVIPHQWELLSKTYLEKMFYSGEYSDIPIAFSPISSLIFHKKHNHIESVLQFVDSQPVQKKIYFYGVSELAKNLVKSYKLEEYNIKGFFDEELSKTGKFRPTKFTIYHSTEIKKLAPDFIILAMLDKNECLRVKNQIKTNVELVKKPEVLSIFFDL